MSKDNKKLRISHTAIRPADKDNNEMFIGWARAPAIDRRFLLGAIPLALAGAGGLSYAIASQLDDPGAGSWQTGQLHSVKGLYSTSPYPHIRVADPARPGGIRTVLVVTEGKCTNVLQKKPQSYRPVTAQGVLIERKNRQMLEVPPLLHKWLADSSDIDPVFVAAQSRLEPTPMGELSLRGTIVDSKCFFGVMRPSRGVVHKACASLCIRGGVPPSFWVRDGKGEERVLLMTTRSGEAISLDILPLVAEPVTVKGQIVRMGDILQLRADVADYHRL